MEKYIKFYLNFSQLVIIIDYLNFKLIKVMCLLYIKVHF